MVRMTTHFSPQLLCSLGIGIATSFLIVGFFMSPFYAHAENSDSCTSMGGTYFPDTGACNVPCDNSGGGGGTDPSCSGGGGGGGYGPQPSNCTVDTTSTTVGSTVTYSNDVSGATTWGVSDPDGTYPATPTTYADDQTFSHIYTTPGTYNSFASTGATMGTCPLVTVSAAPPPPPPVCPAGSTGSPPSCDFCPADPGVQGDVAQCSIAQPDLTGGNPILSGPQIAGQTVTFSGQVFNTGDATAGTFSSYFNIVGPANALAWTGSVSNLPGPNGSAWVGSTHLFTTPGNYTVQLCADGNSQVTESNEGNNCSFPPVSFTIGPPLPTASLTANPNPIVSGNSSTLDYTCTNATSATITASTGAAPGAVSVQKGTANVSPTVTTTYTLWCTNSTGSTSDPVTISVGAAPKPDLGATISGSGVTVGSGQTVSLPITVSNNGAGASSGAFSTYYWVDTDSAHDANPATWGSQSAAIAGPNPMAVNQSQNASANWTAPSLGSATTYYYQACTDWLGQIDESAEGNNCSGWQAVTITPTAMPDLVVGAPSPTLVTAGVSTAFNGTVTNGGASGATGPIYSYIEIQGPGTFGAVGSIASLAANASAAVVANYGFATAGSYLMRWCTDSTGAVNESDEGNNCSFPWTTITVTAPAPPPAASVTSCTFSPSNPAPNQNVTWTAVTSGFAPAATTYTWNVTGGSPASQSGASNSFTTKFPSAGSSYQPSVTATNGSQSASANCSIANVSGTPSSCSSASTPTITASKTRVTVGDSVTLTYGATGIQAGTCKVTGPGGTTLATTATADSSCNIANNSVSTGAINAQSTYTITCGAAKQTVIVNVIPVFKEF
ncbi:MAG: AphP [Parcubacteria group bacterium]|nr:AphP [Parcubacteria group bacterium]